jgi:hypothetical protein
MFDKRLTSPGRSAMAAPVAGIIAAGPIEVDCRELELQGGTYQMPVICLLTGFD